MISVYKNIIPFFSVIITSFNRVKTIQRAINSLSSQSEKDWEAIIVDDGSDDDTFLIARELCRKNHKFRYIYQKNRGQALAKNAGILASSGLYITFLDSDDEYLPEHLEIRKKIIHHYPDLDLLHGGVEIIGDEFVPDINDMSQKIHLSNCIIGGTFFFKRESIMKLNGFSDINYGDDTDLYQKAQQLNLTIGKTEIRTYKYYRNQDDSLCNNINNEKIQ